MSIFVPLDDITLRTGAHETREEGVCLMEAAAWYAGEPHSDSPACVSLLLADFGRRLNDRLPDDLRIRLLPFVPRVVGTAGDGMDERRGFMVADWIIRTYTPTWLRAAGMEDEARALEALPEVVDSETMAGTMDALNRARQSADAARFAAGPASASGDDAWHAAWHAAVDTPGGAWDASVYAAASAAGADLAPTVRDLHVSVIALFDRMVSLRPAGAEVVVPERVLLRVDR